MENIQGNIFEDMYDTYMRGMDFKIQSSKNLQYTNRRQRDAHRIIPENVQQRAKDREEKKKFKRAVLEKKKIFDITRNQSRVASGRSQEVNHTAIEKDNELGDELFYELGEDYRLYEFYVNECIDNIYRN
jgi:hypothetical protein